MGTGAVFFWGWVPGIWATVVFFVAPAIWTAHKDGNLTITFWRVLLLGLFVIFVSAFGGMAALQLSNPDRADAIQIGIASVCTIKAIASAGVEVVRSG